MNNKDDWECKCGMANHHLMSFCMKCHEVRDADLVSLRPIDRKYIDEFLEKNTNTPTEDLIYHWKTQRNRAITWIALSACIIISGFPVALWGPKGYWDGLCLLFFITGCTFLVPALLPLVKFRHFANDELCVFMRRWKKKHISLTPEERQQLLRAGYSYHLSQLSLQRMQDNGSGWSLDKTAENLAFCHSDGIDDFSALQNRNNELYIAKSEMGKRGYSGPIRVIRVNQDLFHVYVLMGETYESHAYGDGRVSIPGGWKKWNFI